MAYRLDHTALKRFKKAIVAFNGDLKQGHRQILLKVGSLILNDAKKLAPVQSGALRASGRIERHSDTEYSVAFGGSGTQVDYATFVEFGRSPGRAPPIRELRTWSARRLGDEYAAGAIARVIARRGVRPQPFLRPAIKMNERHLIASEVTNVTRAWNRAAARYGQP